MYATQGLYISQAMLSLVRAADVSMQQGQAPLQNVFLADIDPLQIFLPNHPQGNGMFATVQLKQGATLTNDGQRHTALLACTATTIFDTSAARGLLFRAP